MIYRAPATGRAEIAVPRRVNPPTTTRLVLLVVALLLALGAVFGLVLGFRTDSSSLAPRPSSPLAAAIGGAESIQPIPLPPAGEARRIDLGRRLFSERRLSSDGTISCESCHSLDSGGADGRTVAIGVGGALGASNTPTVWNAALNPMQFWDGRAESLEAQIDGPLTNAVEMGSSWPRALVVLQGDAAYARAFAEAYPEGVTPNTIKDAIASFERTLITAGSPFDRYLEGDKNALSTSQLEGYALFKSYGCASCHQGRNVGGNMFQKMGIMGDYFAERGGPITTADLGRFNVTHREQDRFKFRVPSLRLAARTAPYFHDGRVETLERAITLMGKLQLGEDIPAHDVKAISEFLECLAGPTHAELPHAAR